jgi:hypothetical protein
MPNADHIAVLERGAATWNAWCTEQDVTPDLSRAGLRGLDLSGFDLSRADLRGADLRGTNFSHANRSGSHMVYRARGECRLNGSPIINGAGLPGTPNSTR